MDKLQAVKALHRLLGLVVVPALGLVCSCGWHLEPPCVTRSRIVEVQEAIAGLRGLDFVSAPRVELLDDEDMRVRLTRLRESEDSLAMIRLWSTIDAAFGHPWSVDPATAARRLPSDGGFGVYDPEDDALLLSRPRLRRSPTIDLSGFLRHGASLGELVVTHELTHAWQHRHFPELFAASRNVDCWALRRALLEGDAEVTTLALMRHSIDDEALDDYLRLRRQMATAAGQRPEENRDWQLRYQHATRYLYDVLRKRGWEGLNAVLAEPPPSTAALFEGRGANPAAADVEADDLVCPSGWTQVVNTTVGPFYLPPLLKLPGNPAAIKGWRSDRLRICSGERPDQFVLRWHTRWLDDEAAERFLDAARDHLRRRHPALRQSPHVAASPLAWAERRGRVVVMADASMGSWVSSLGDGVPEPEF